MTRNDEGDGVQYDTFNDAGPGEVSDAGYARLAARAEAARAHRAYKLGSIDAYAERPARDMSDTGSAWLMDELGETSPTTEANAPYRAMLCERYIDGYCDAAKALRV